MSTEAKVVRRPDVRGGSLTIDGTRITVTDIVRVYRTELPQVANWYEGPPDPDAGFRISIDVIAGEVRQHFPHLSKEQIIAALRYWREHEPEIQDELDEEDMAAIHARRKYSRRP